MSKTPVSKQKRLMERASILNGESGKAQITVVASKDDTLDVVSSFKCGDCTMVFASNKELKPFCVNCGSDKVTASDAEVNENLTPDDVDLSAVECPSCEARNIISDVTASAMDGKMHCVSCASPIHYLTAADDVEFEDLDVSESDDVPEEAGDELDENNNVEEDAGDENTNINVDDTGDDVNLENLATEDAPASTPAVAVPDETTADADADANADANDNANENLDEVADETNLDMNTDENNSNDDSNAVEYSLVESAGAEVDFVYHGNTVYAFSNEMPIAYLKQETAGSNSEIFHQQSFVQALVATAKSMGVAKTLANYKFEPIMIAVANNKIIDAEVAKQVEAKTKELSSQASQLVATFKQCLSIAASGLNKGYFRNVSHPLKAQFHDSLSSLGIRSAAATKVIDSTFASVGNAFNKILIEKAFELMDKPIEIRNSLAETVEDTNYINADDNDDSGEDNLENAAVVASVSEVTAGEFKSPGEIRKGVKGKFFSVSTL